MREDRNHIFPGFRCRWETLDYLGETPSCWCETSSTESATATSARPPLAPRCWSGTLYCLGETPIPDLQRGARGRRGGRLGTGRFPSATERFAEVIHRFPSATNPRPNVLFKYFLIQIPLRKTSFQEIQAPNRRQELAQKSNLRGTVNIFVFCSDFTFFQNNYYSQIQFCCVFKQFRSMIKSSISTFPQWIPTWT